MVVFLPPFFPISSRSSPYRTRIAPLKSHSIRHEHIASITNMAIYIFKYISMSLLNLNAENCVKYGRDDSNWYDFSYVERAQSCSNKDVAFISITLSAATHMVACTRLKIYTHDTMRIDFIANSDCWLLCIHNVFLSLDSIVFIPHFESIRVSLILLVGR